MPGLTYENQHSNDFKHIFGVDEVGRGPWAGPVVACACVIPPNVDLPSEITDSKKLSRKKREFLAKFLIENIPFALGEVSSEEIDKLNILQATFIAMDRAVEGLKERLNCTENEFFVLVDGNKLPTQENFKNAESIIKGDGKSLTIASASIIAKVYRDKLMAKYSEEYPFYAWEKNAGYGTKAHQEGLAIHGVTPLHRKSYKPIAKLLSSK